MLVGAMLEQLTDTGWEELIRAKLFEPLNMHGAGFGSPGPDQPLGHRQGSEGEWTPVPTGPAADNPAALGPAGTVHIDHLSWTPYLAAHLDMAQGELGADSPFSALHAPPEGGDYAAGWAIRDAPEGIEGPMYIHRGSNTMWLSTVILLPSLDIAFVCNANAADFQPVAEGCMNLLKTTLARRTSP
jgi:CubicO group peptidase (beta-lactamase class C family)